MDPATGKMTHPYRADSEIRMLREYRAGGWSIAELAFFFEMSATSVSNACQGKTYPNAGGPVADKNHDYNGHRGRAPVKSSPEIRKAVKDLAKKGLPQGKIAAQISVSFDLDISQQMISLMLRDAQKPRKEH